MLLGVALQMGILLLCGWVGAERAQQDLLVCMITYTLLFSLTVTSFFSMPVTRYLADMLYEEREQAILPSFWGSSSLMLVLGCRPVRAVPPCLRGHPAAGAALPVALRGDDRELERHELPHGHQGLPGHPLLVFSRPSGWRSGWGWYWWSCWASRCRRGCSLPWPWAMA